MSRRAMLSGGAFVALQGSPVFGLARAAVADGPRLALVRTLAAMTLPDTDTPGAGSEDVARWVLTALRRGMRGGSPATLDVLHGALDAATPGGAFDRAPLPVRLAALKTLDTQLSPFTVASGPSAPWAVIKSLIVRGYYNSEIGASKELRYELVPARYDPDLAVKPGDRAWSSDALARGTA